MTPEGKIKAKIAEVLREHNAYYFMPVQTGYGRAGLDFHCMAKGGLAFFIEAKSPGKKVNPQSRQQMLINELRARGAAVFIISDDKGIEELGLWLELLPSYNKEISLTTTHSR